MTGTVRCIFRWGAPVCCSAGSTRRGGWPTAQSNPRSGRIDFVPYALHLLGDIATHPDRFDAERAEAHYREALALAEPRGMRPLVAHCHLGLGTLYARMGKREQATEHLETAAAMYRDMDMRFWLEQAEAELNDVRAPSLTSRSRSPCAADRRRRRGRRSRGRW